MPAGSFEIQEGSPYPQLERSLRRSYALRGNAASACRQAEACLEHPIGPAIRSKTAIRQTLSYFQVI
jgi:hypothetical protein